MSTAGRHPVVGWLIVLLWALSAAFSMELGPPLRTITIEMGNEAGLNAQGQGEHLYNFFGWGNPGTERGKLARRIDPVASLMVPWAFNMGQPGRPLQVAITMCGCVGGAEAGSTEAAGSVEDVLLVINGISHKVPLSNDWEHRRFTVHHEPTLYNQSLYLEWQSDATPRPLVHSVRISSERRANLIGPVGWLLLGIVAVLVLAAIWQGAALHELYWFIVVISSATLGIRFYEPQLLPWPVLLALGGGGAVALMLCCRVWWHRLALWLLMLWLLAVPQVLGTWILDDAFISFRYARNLVEGFGLTFNPGGELVEGYTNFLWTIGIAGVLAAGGEPVLIAQAINTALALVALLLIYRFAVAWWPGRTWCLLPPLLLACNPAFLLYTTRGSGMETALVTVLALAALWLIWRAADLRGGLLAGLASALVVLARPDGALVPLAGGLLLLGRVAIGSERRQAAATLAGLVLGFLLLYAPYFAWRYSSYGYLLPNTFYAKTGATVAQVERGFAYTRDFVQSLGLRSLALLLGLSLFGLVRATQQTGTADQRSPAPLLWLFVLLTCLYVTLVGGDHFPLGRFFVPMLPPLLLLVVHGAMQAGDLATLLRGWVVRLWPNGALDRWRGRGAASARLLPNMLAALALLLFLYLNVSPLPQLDSRDPSGRIWGENYVALKNRELGWWFYYHTPPDTVIATGIAGAMPYYARRQVIDTLGLNNTHIAHLPIATIGQGVAGAEKTDIAYVLDQQPDYIPFATSGPYQENARFQGTYRQLTVRGPEGGELILYRRTDEPHTDAEQGEE